MAESETEPFGIVDKAWDGFGRLRRRHGPLRAGLIIVVLASVCLWWNWDEIIKRPGVDRFLKSIQKSARFNSPVSPAPEVATPKKPTPIPREFVDLNFDALSAQTKGLNGILAGRVYAVYVGKWIQVAGQIDDVTPAGNTGPIVVRFQAPTRNAGTVYMTFDRARWADHLGAMSRGDALAASCRIELVQLNGMSLSDCEVQ